MSSVNLGNPLTPLWQTANPNDRGIADQTAAEVVLGEFSYTGEVQIAPFGCRGHTLYASSGRCGPRYDQCAVCRGYASHSRA